ncbi:MAG: Gfo/Idh/MocA family oxidoreductase [Candidatus Omnitrophica bacterium]|nr:Gfo/Idh/MocA family oxidoreductase [Candidatus Omnitrophota bacterium]
MNVGIIGAGRMGVVHVNALKKIDWVKIVAVCDLLVERAVALAKELSAKAYTDYQEMLDREKIEAVWICTPADVHPENVLACIERGVPFFLEKPVAVKKEDGEVVVRKIEKEGIYHAVGYIFRYSPVVAKLKELLQEEQIIFPAGEYFWTIPLVDSIKSKEKAGGQIVDQATHMIDLMRYTVGEITTVYTGRSRGFFPEESLYTGDDASGTVFEFASGISGSLVCTYALFPEIVRYYPPKLRVICKRKLIEWSGNEIRVITPDKETKFELKSDLVFLEDQAFLDGLRKQDRSLVKSSYQDALKTLKVCLAANQSMETGEKVIIG